MTAEFVAVVPAVLLVLACCLSGVQLATLQVRVQDAAAVVARAGSRGDAIAVSSLVAGAAATSRREGQLLCVTVGVSSPIVGGLLGSIALSARSCAAMSSG
ncbi:MAG: hypothetical protein KF680_06415 [Cryobacterium sp.]|nr:hypothetical protein [Cryobacterium sp.]